jgi:hypothetical protein
MGGWPLTLESLRQRIRRPRTISGARPGLHRRMGQDNGLEREVRELRRANEVLKIARRHSSRGSSTGNCPNSRLDRRPRPPVRSRADLRVLTEHGCKTAPNTCYLHREHPALVHVRTLISTYSCPKEPALNRSIEPSLVLPRFPSGLSGPNLFTTGVIQFNDVPEAGLS